MQKLVYRMRKGTPITVLHVFSGDLWAGAEVMVYNLLKNLKDDPHLEIVALSLNDGVLSRKLAQAGIPTRVIPEAGYSFPGIIWKAFRHLRGKKIGIIHSHRYKENLLAFILSRLLRIRITVATLHGLVEPTPGMAMKWRLRFRVWMDYLLLRRFFSRVVAVSQDVKRRLIGEHGFEDTRVVVIHNGIKLDPVATPPGKDRSAPGLIHIGTVGRLVEVKDYELFLQVAAAVKDRFPAVHFSILGDGPLKEKLMNKARELDLGDTFEILAPQTDPRPYYQSLDIYLNTSIHEGLPLSILEAMACGIPVVASKVGGIPEVIIHGDDGFLVAGRKMEGFVDGCLRLMEDEGLRKRVGRKASEKIASSFCVSRMGESYRELYFGLME
jgi:glycosyltransferase involved in cell wall biosynthesis